MFKCAICGKEYSNMDMDEIRLLNKQTNELESFHVCSTCVNNKEDMVAYLAGKKTMSPVEARHMYDYFIPLVGDIETPLLAKYIEGRLKLLRTKLADTIEEDAKSTDDTKTESKKKMSVFKRLKTALIAVDGVVSIALFVLMIIIAAINPSVTAASIIMGIILSISVFVSMYFAIDSYVRMREDSYKILKQMVKNPEELAVSEDENETE